MRSSWLEFSMRRRVAEPLRVLVAGWLNSPHVTAWVEAVKAAGHDVHLAGRDAPQLPASASNEKVHRLPADAPPLVRGLRMSHALGRVAADLSPDLVHAHFLTEFGWMAAREGLRPLISSAWGSDIFGVRGLSRGRSRRALEGSQLAFADSRHLARATREFADVRVEVVRWGLDMDAYAPGNRAAAREALGIDHDGPLVASVRGLDPLYNPVLLLEAFGRVHQRRPNTRLLLKNQKQHVTTKTMRAIEQLGLGGAVIMIGNVLAERMPDVYRAADVVVSIPSSDSSPRSVWEALGCGSSVVVSDLPWAREDLVDGKHAVLTELEPLAVAEAIERALDDEQLGAEGRRLAETELDASTWNVRIDALYRSVVENG
jgi:glycosyltransferase involved in cell wall biosynthesis